MKQGEKKSEYIGEKITDNKKRVKNKKFTKQSKKNKKLDHDKYFNLKRL